MKKILAMILALAMILSMSAFAFATDVSTNGNTESDVKVTVTGNDTKVYRIEIRWDALEFTYNMGKWNTVTHQYDEGTWSSAKEISIINHSNAAVTAEAAYQVGAGLANVSFTLTTTRGNTTLESAAEVAFGTANKDANTLENSIVYSLAASGNPQEPTGQVTVGKVIVTISGI